MQRYRFTAAALLFLPLLLVPSVSIDVAASRPSSQGSSQPEILLPLEPGSTRFAVIGDSGTGKDPQYEVGALMAGIHQTFPFEFVLMLGDNLYGSENPRDYEKKFDRPYKPLLESGVKFYASLGNHDNPSQRFYKDFNMGGERYYSFKKGDARFFALDSTHMSPQQLEWVEKELRDSDERWKICFFHHPLYSSGKRHGASVELRETLEPLFRQFNVNVVMSGHEHFYERILPQHGIYYFISGGAGQLRYENIRRSDITAKGFARDRHFMIVEIKGDEFHFQALSRRGETVDSGCLQRIAAGQAGEGTVTRSAAPQ
jgi:hypothetical protein